MHIVVHSIAVTFPDGTIEHNYLGPHPDQSKTKNLQNQVTASSARVDMGRVLGLEMGVNSIRKTYKSVLVVCTCTPCVCL